MKITLKGWEADKKLNTSGLAAMRIYATDNVYFFPSGVRKPKPNTWRLVHEAKLKTQRGKLAMPDIELEPSAEDGQPGTQLYTHVAVDSHGREVWHDENEFVLPALLGESIGLYELTIYNMRLRGEPCEWEEWQPA